MFGVPYYNIPTPCTLLHIHRYLPMSIPHKYTFVKIHIFSNIRVYQVSVIEMWLDSGSSSRCHFLCNDVCDRMCRSTLLCTVACAATQCTPGLYTHWTHQHTSTRLKVSTVSTEGWDVCQCFSATFLVTNWVNIHTTHSNSVASMLSYLHFTSTNTYVMSIICCRDINACKDMSQPKCAMFYSVNSPLPSLGRLLLVI